MIEKLRKFVITNVLYLYIFYFSDDLVENSNYYRRVDFGKHSKWNQ